MKLNILKRLGVMLASSSALRTGVLFSALSLGGMTGDVSAASGVAPSMSLFNPHSSFVPFFDALGDGNITKLSEDAMRKVLGHAAAVYAVRNLNESSAREMVSRLGAGDYDTLIGRNSKMPARLVGELPMDELGAVFNIQSDLEYFLAYSVNFISGELDVSRAKVWPIIKKLISDKIAQAKDNIVVLDRQPMPFDKFNTLGNAYWTARRAYDAAPLADRSGLQSALDAATDAFIKLLFEYRFENVMGYSKSLAHEQSETWDLLLQHVNESGFTVKDAVTMEHLIISSCNVGCITMYKFEFPADALASISTSPSTSTPPSPFYTTDIANYYVDKRVDTEMKYNPLTSKVTFDKTSVKQPLSFVDTFVAAGCLPYALQQAPRLFNYSADFNMLSDSDYTFNTEYDTKYGRKYTKGLSSRRDSLIAFAKESSVLRSLIDTSTKHEMYPMIVEAQYAIYTGDITRAQRLIGAVFSKAGIVDDGTLINAVLKAKSFLCSPVLSHSAVKSSCAEYINSLNKKAKEAKCFSGLMKLTADPMSNRVALFGSALCNEINARSRGLYVLLRPQSFVGTGTVTDINGDDDDVTGVSSVVGLPNDVVLNLFNALSDASVVESPLIGSAMSKHLGLTTRSSGSLISSLLIPKEEMDGQYQTLLTVEGKYAVSTDYYGNEDENEDENQDENQDENEDHDHSLQYNDIHGNDVFSPIRKIMLGVDRAIVEKIFTPESIRLLPLIFASTSPLTIENCNKSINMVANDGLLLPNWEAGIPSGNNEYVNSIKNLLRTVKQGMMPFSEPVSIRGSMDISLSNLEKGYTSSTMLSSELGTLPEGKISDDIMRCINTETVYAENLDSVTLKQLRAQGSALTINAVKAVTLQGAMSTTQNEVLRLCPFRNIPASDLSSESSDLSVLGLSEFSQLLDAGDAQSSIENLLLMYSRPQQSDKVTSMQGVVDFARLVSTMRSSGIIKITTTYGVVLETSFDQFIAGVKVSTYVECVNMMRIIDRVKNANTKSAMISDFNRTLKRTELIFGAAGVDINELYTIHEFNWRTNVHVTSILGQPNAFLPHYQLGKAVRENRTLKADKGALSAAETCKNIKTLVDLEGLLQPKGGELV